MYFGSFCFSSLLHLIVIFFMVFYSVRQSDVVPSTIKLKSVPIKFVTADNIDLALKKKLDKSLSDKTTQKNTSNSVSEKPVVEQKLKSTSQSPIQKKELNVPKNLENSKKDTKTSLQNSNSFNTKDKKNINSTNIIKKESSKDQNKKPSSVKKKEVLKKEKDIISSLLKDLENTNDYLENHSEKEVEIPKKKAHENTQKDTTLSISEKLLIKSKIESNWNPPFLLSKADKNAITMLLNIKIRPDGSIEDVSVKNVKCNLDKQKCNLLVDSAIKAVFLSSPISGLSSERYNLWKEFNLLFNPNEID